MEGVLPHLVLWIELLIGSDSLGVRLPHYRKPTVWKKSRQEFVESHPKVLFEHDFPSQGGIKLRPIPKGNSSSNHGFSGTFCC